MSTFKYPVTFIEVSPSKRKEPLEWNLSTDKAQRELQLSARTGYANIAEAQKVIQVLSNLLLEKNVYEEQKDVQGNKDSVLPIGIITFYTGQAELIRRMIKNYHFLDAQEQTNNGIFICKSK